MTDNLLDNTPPAPPTDYLKELVGEGKKFKTVEDLARGKYEADNMVETLKRTSDELRADYLKLDADYKARAKLEEYVDQLASRQQLTHNQEPPVREVKDPAIDPKQIETLVDSKLKEIETKRTQQENLDKVGKVLKEHFGDNFQSTVKKQLETLDLTEDDFYNLARTRPNFLLKALEADKTPSKENFQAPPRSNVRSDTFTPSGGTKRTWSYYQELKKTNPDLYRSPKTNVQMHNDMMELGDAFKDGDFSAYGD